MYAKLAIALFIIALIVSFSKDWYTLLEKLFSYRFFKLIVPLSVITCVWLIYESFFTWLLVKIHITMLQAILILTDVFRQPNFGKFIASIGLFATVNIVPTVAIYFWNQYRPYRRIEYIWRINLFIWLFMVMLLVSDLTLR